eukprot:8261049-Pyramimonas_sp.AAC.1
MAAVAELRSFVTGTRNELLEAVARLQSNVTEFGAGVSKFCDNISKQVKARFADLQAQQNNAQVRVSALERQVADLQQLLHCIKADEPTAVVQYSSFNRHVDPCILVIRSKAVVAAKDVENSVGAWLE